MRAVNSDAGFEVFRPTGPVEGAPATSTRGPRRSLFRQWESPEHGDEPFATLTDRNTALLAAAFLPLVDRTRSFSVDPEDAGGPVL